MERFEKVRAKVIYKLHPTKNINLIQWLWKDLFERFTNSLNQIYNDQFVIRIARNAKEACKLIEVGFEYVTGEYSDGGKIFRKRK